MEEWYSPRQIEFVERKHIEWLISQLGTLKEGNWPKEPPKRPDGMEEDTQPIRKAHIKARAYFETPIQFAAEIEERLDLCRHDGQLAELVYRFGKTYQELSRRYRISEEAIVFRVESAIECMAGAKRKRFYDRYRNITHPLPHKRKSGEE